MHKKQVAASSPYVISLENQQNKTEKKLLKEKKGLRAKLRKKSKFFIFLCSVLSSESYSFYSDNKIKSLQQENEKMKQYCHVARS